MRGLESGTVLFDELTGSSTFAYANSPGAAPQPNRAQRRAEEAAKRKATRQFNREIARLVAGGIYGDEK